MIEQPPSASAFRLASTIRETAKFDAAIVFHPNWKVTFAFWLARIPIRVGRRDGLISRLYNQHPPPLQEDTAVRANLHVAQSVGANINQARG